MHIYYSCPPLPVQILQFRVRNLVFSCLPKAISNRRYSHILFLPTPASADSPISCAKLGVFMPSQSHFKQKIFTLHILFRPTPASADSPISCAKLGVFMPSQSHFKQKIFTYYSCPPLPVQILQFRVQNLVFSCLPKAISNIRYAHILFLPTPASADSPISCAKLGVFMPSQSHFKQKIFTYIIPAHPCQCRFSNFVCKTWCFHAFPKPFQIEDIHIYYSCPPLPVQILQFRLQNFVFSCLPKAISVEDMHIHYSCPPLPVQILQFHVQNLVFSCLPKAIANRRYSHILFLPTPASADSPILCAKLGVFISSQSHFKQKIFTYIIPAHPCQCRFSNFVCKTWCFHAFPKPFQIEDIHILFLPIPASADSPISCSKLCVFMPSQSHFKQKIFTYYSCPPLPVQILQFRVQNFVFSCLPKAISNRRYSHILFLPTPASADSPLSCAKLCVFMPSQSHFKQKIFTYPPLPMQILQFRVQNLVFARLAKAISNRRYAHTLFLPTPASADSPISCAKLGVLMPSQRNFKQKICTYIIPAQPCQCRFSNFVCKTLCFHAFPKPFQIEDIHIHCSSISCAKLCVFMPFQSHFKQKIFTYYSCPPLPVQIHQFYVQNFVFSCLPKAISVEDMHILFLPTPASADSPISCAKLCVFMPFQSHFKQKIFTYYSCPPLPVQILQFRAQNLVFSCLPKSISNRRYSHI